MDLNLLTLYWQKVNLQNQLLTFNSYTVSKSVFFFLGIPSIGILPIDPMRITTLEVNQGEGAVKLKMKYRDLEILNLQSATIKNITYACNIVKNLNIVSKKKKKKPNEF